jgi:NTE family protein
VPGYFQPVPIEGRTYVDGGVRSPTNANVLSRRRDLDLIIIVSPMSGRELGYMGLSNVVRRRARRTVQGERQRLQQAGIPSVLLEPGPEVIAALGTDYMSSTNLTNIVGTAFLDTGEQLQAPITRTLLAGLNGRIRPSAPRPGRGA